MTTSNGRDIALDTVKSDLVALQHELEAVKRRSLDVVERRVANQPVQSVLIAFAAGIICSKLFLRRFL
jgi:ElaB/YqjD/DUF883 family membrane-anchored ribosome-binding protein